VIDCTHTWRTFPRREIIHLSGDLSGLAPSLHEQQQPAINSDDDELIMEELTSAQRPFSGEFPRAVVSIARSCPSQQASPTRTHPHARFSLCEKLALPWQLPLTGCALFVTIELCDVCGGFGSCRISRRTTGEHQNGPMAPSCRF